MLPETLVRFRRPLVVALHAVLIPLGYALAFGLRFDFQVPPQYVEVFLETLPFLVVLRFAAFVLFGVNRGWWRHAGMNDLLALIQAISTSSLLLTAGLFLMNRLDGLPRSVLLLDWVMAILIFGGIRFAVRVGREGRLSRLRPRGTPTLIIGAGEAAERLIRQLRRGDGLQLNPVGLVDDDPAKAGMSLHGAHVVGTTHDLSRLVERCGAKLLVIAIPSASREEMTTLVDRCMRTGVPFKIVPALHELVEGRAKIGQLRDVQIEDLLGREPIQMDLDLVARDLEGKRVLVTGGAGSIGSELARQIASFRPARLVLVDQAESPLYFVNLEISRTHPSVEVVPIVADITDGARLTSAFGEHRPDYVFHAAAYKHVPLMEANVREAVRNNVLGTLRVAECAAEHGCRRFVLISTDKAVNPSSVMGATKRIAERIVLGWPALRASGTDFRAVRFGNVLGSDGSVVPLFRRQLAEGGPLTVTDRDVTRYFMTIPEAVQLVLQGWALPEGRSRISMLEMGEPVRIVDLAENLVRLSGLEPYRDVPIVFTGLRPGEKLHEELMSKVESTVETEIQKIRLVQTDEPGGAAIREGLDRLLVAAELNDRDDLLLAICAMVPECKPPLREMAQRLGALR